MAINHYTYEHSSQYGQLLHGPMLSLENDIDNLKEIFGTMQQMIDGDGSNATHYATIQVEFGFVDNDQAKAAFAEIASGLGALDGVAATVQQMINKLR